ncbi:hypothetical protein I5V52_19105 [Stenotrophomonas maltophilia]|uniref:hypothetical protein n=1 Tax=Stenotrophomonas TaxID=40323 RepID=UPI000C14B630|nr:MULTISPECIES: hypothetical protein [Stenotrophomonas]MBH1578330.1 hypothetical protein [Stenotrophomonas maltophilia]MBH1598389.1 hypothetical protein [Stenotrophomonas maltophilia]MBH1604598.1 hypothetical protein [Stenotrophomonas maltophilia]MBH1760920.1 hypothetical protein [Stenotrophomonas maltophilia]MBH1763366.1 hypothetical protein [Stenotrophomonas maltophilia]
MPVSDPLAFDLLRAFAQLEFRLKNDPGFLRAGPYRMAQVNWPAVDEAVSRLDDSLFFDRVSDSTHEQILTPPRDRPMVQEVAVVNGLNRTVFQRLPLQQSNAGALVEAARRVRNNLFHGGKEEPHFGDDDEWAAAALDVAECLLHLLNHGTLRSGLGP